MKMDSAQQLRGLVLCTVGKHRLAFPAVEIVSVEAVTAKLEPGRYIDARAVFGSPLGDGRAVLGDDGASLVVDGLDVQQETLQLLRVPPILGQSLGQSLTGFVHWRELLWPVFQLSKFSAFVGQMAKEGRFAS